MVDVTRTVGGTLPNSQRSVQVGVTLPDESAAASVPLFGQIFTGSASDAPANVAIVVDVSGSTGSTFQGDLTVGDANGDGASEDIIDAEIVAVEALIQSIVNDAGRPQTDVGLISFASGANLELATTAGADDDGDQVNDVVAAARQLNYGGGTSFSAALQATYDYFQSISASPTDNNLVFFLSDGQSSSGETEAEALRNDFNASIRALGVGQNASESQLDLIDDGNNNDSAIIVTDPSRLQFEITQADIPVASIQAVDITVNGQLVGTVDPATFSVTPFSITFDTTVPLNVGVDDTVRAFIRFDEDGDGTTDLEIVNGQVVEEPPQQPSIPGTPVPVPDACADPDSGRGSSDGDPHISTFDGLGYSFQAVGEFVLSRSTDAGQSFQVQVRQAALPGSATVSQNVALAVRVDGNVVEINAEPDDPLMINGNVVNLADGDSIAVGAGEVRRDGDEYFVTTEFGDCVWARVSTFLNVRVYANEGWAGLLEGLLGDFDGVAGNDLAADDGTAFGLPVDSNLLYGDYAEEWRVTDANSLFTYGAGENTGTFTNRNFPSSVVTIDDLDPAARAAAEAAAIAAGLTPGTFAFETTVVDIALTGNTEFAQAVADEPNVPAEAGDDEPTFVVDFSNDPNRAGCTPQTIIGNDRPELLLGGQCDDTINGNGGNDTIEGFGGDDVIRGGLGADQIEAGGGNDVVLGQEGNDSIDGGNGNDGLAGHAGFDTITGGFGNDSIDGGTGADVLFGNAGNDLIRGDDGADRMIGGEGRDTLYGEEGDDLLLGREGDDILLGRNGNDFLNGGEGRDVLVGNAGEDIYVLNDLGGLARVKGFFQGIDTFALSGDLEYEDLSFSGTDIMADGDVIARVVGFNTSTLTEADFVII